MDYLGRVINTNNTAINSRSTGSHTGSHQTTDDPQDGPNYGTHEHDHGWNWKQELASQVGTQGLSAEWYHPYAAKTQNDRQSDKPTGSLDNKTLTRPESLASQDTGFDPELDADGDSSDPGLDADGDSDDSELAA